LLLSVNPPKVGNLQTNLQNNIPISQPARSSTLSLNTALRTSIHVLNMPYPFNVLGGINVAQNGWAKASNFRDRLPPASNSRLDPHAPYFNPGK
jgi:hypothetical protein